MQKKSCIDKITGCAGVKSIEKDDRQHKEKDTRIKRREERDADHRGGNRSDRSTDERDVA